MPKRVLLDECLPRQLKRSIEGHHVRTVPETGWAGKKNGELLDLAASDFDVFVTVDRNLAFQGKVRTEVAVIVIVTRGNRLVDLLPLVPKLCVVLETVERGQIVQIGV